MAGPSVHGRLTVQQAVASQPEVREAADRRTDQQRARSVPAPVAQQPVRDRRMDRPRPVQSVPVQSVPVQRVPGPDR